MFDVNTGLLAGILASQWLLAKKAGIPEATLKQAVSGGLSSQLVAQGMVPFELPEGLFPFSRYELDLTTARDMVELPFAGQWLTVESCTGTDVAVYIDQKGAGATPDPLYLDRVISFSYPFKRLYIKHSAQAGKSLKLIVGRINLSLEKESPTLALINAALATLHTDLATTLHTDLATTLHGDLGTTLHGDLATTLHGDITVLRWGVAREPAWVDGGEQTAPGAGTDLATKTVTAGKTGRLFGISIAADEANTFDVYLDATATLHYALAAAGQLVIVLPTPIKNAIAAGTVIDLRNVTAAGAGKVYHAMMLYDEA